MPLGTAHGSGANYQPLCSLDFPAQMVPVICGTHNISCENCLAASCHAGINDMDNGLCPMVKRLRCLLWISRHIQPVTADAFDSSLSCRDQLSFMQMNFAVIESTP